VRHAYIAQRVDVELADLHVPIIATRSQLVLCGVDGDVVRRDP